MTLTELIKKFRKKRILFTTPSHNQGEYIIPEAKKLLGKEYFKSDFSEIEGFDNLHHPEGILIEINKKIADINRCKRSYMLTNGSSQGIIALMLACLKPNDKVLINRNCHVSVCNGLTLSGAYPVFCDFETIPEWGIIKPLKVSAIKDAINNNSGIKAAIITSPTYEGLYASIEEIAEICHQNNIILIVDEAHGALCTFSENLPQSSIIRGADACVQSLHKTAGAVNPAAILHLSENSLISEEKVSEALNMITTTSPSYPLMANIEVTVDFLNSKKGKKILSELFKNINDFQKDILQYDNISMYCVDNDITKILLKIDDISGYTLETFLFEKFKIEAELANEKSVLFLTGIGTTKKKLNILKKTICKIAKRPDIAQKYEVSECGFNPVKPIFKTTPSYAYYSNYEEVKPEEAVGRVSKENLLAYPPGIPFVFAGEIILKQHVQYLKENYDKIKVLK